MNGFYEKFRDEQSEVAINRNGDHVFLPHYHQQLEVFIVKAGGYTLMIGNERYEMRAGTLAIVDSYQIHGYENPCKDERVNDCVVIFPPSTLSQFNAWRKNGAIATPILQDESLCDELLWLVDRYMPYTQSERTREAGAQLFLARLFEKLTFTDTREERGEGALVRKILEYIETQYQSDCTRKTIARALGYTEAHISRVFHKYMHRGISTYVNERRLKHVTTCKRLGDTRTETDLLYEAGFGSEQTYYRFKKRMKNERNGEEN